MKNRITIYDIKRAVAETESHFFTRKTLRWFGQTMKDFKVYKQSETCYYITAPIRHRDMITGITEKYFNTVTKQLTSKP